jgi:hypothetical protein
VDNLLLLNSDLGKLMAKAVTMSDESDGHFRNSTKPTANRLCPLRDAPTYSFA